MTGRQQQRKFCDVSYPIFPEEGGGAAAAHQDTSIFSSFKIFLVFGFFLATFFQRISHCRALRSWFSEKWIRKSDDFCRLERDHPVWEQEVGKNRRCEQMLENEWNHQRKGIPSNWFCYVLTPAWLLGTFSVKWLVVFSWTPIHSLASQWTHNLVLKWTNCSSWCRGSL